MDNILSNKNVTRFLNLAEKVKEHGPESLTPAELQWAQEYVSAVIEEVIVPLVKVLKDAAKEIAISLAKAMDALSDAAWTTANLEDEKRITSGKGIAADLSLKFSGPINMADLGLPELGTLDASSPAINKMEEGLARQIQREVGLVQQARLNEISGRRRYNS
jgi:hypothetical protein